MLRKPLLALTCAMLIAAGFVYGLARLFTLRFESGDVYPPYSTLRADPLGAKGLFASLEALPGVEVQRNFQPLKKLQPTPPITLAYLGAPHGGYWTERELAEFETLVFGGARAVFAFFPIDRPPPPAEAQREEDEARDRKKEREKEEAGKDQDGKKKKAGEDEESSGLLPFAKVAKRLGFQFAFLPPPAEKAYDRHAFVIETGGQLERDLSWHSALYFKDLAPEWKPLYLSETEPVIIERSYGRGSIVLAADSYFFSNEALRRERHPRLLARIFSGPPRVIFDEEHLGVTNQEGIAQLALRYRLHGVIAGLVLIAALFVWKNSVRFVPAHPDARSDGGMLAGRGVAEGFHHLLQRALPPGDLLEACVTEWRRSTPRRDAALATVVEILDRERALPPKRRDPVAAYREISRALSRKTHA